MHRLRACLPLLALAFFILTASPAFAVFHTFKIVEIYSSADGSVQYVKLKENFGFGSQNLWSGITLSSTNASNPADINQITFPNNLPNSATANKFVLVATANFASLSGGITPDYVIPANFLHRSGGTLNFGGVSIINYAALPTNGQSALTDTGATVINAPRNFAGASGSVNLPPGSCCVAAACTITILPSCTGTFSAAGVCTPNPCAPSTGTCCAGATCSITSAAACTGDHRLFLSASSACNSASNLTAPCCRADYNHIAGTTVQDIFDFLNDWFASSSLADFDTNGAAAPTVGSIFSFLNAWFAGGC